MKPIPTIKELFTGIKTSFRSRLGAIVPDSGKSFLRDIGAVWAGKLGVAYKYLGSLQKNAWYDTADGGGPTSMLWRMGYSFLGEYPKAGTQGQYLCTVTGNSGAIIPANTTFLSDADSQSPNLLFILDTAYTMPATTGTITLRALTAGTAAALAVDNTLTATKPLVNVDSGAAVTSITVSPIDAETDEEYRARLDNHVKLAPQGGSGADYRIWASDAAGVAKAYPYTASGGLWQVNVFIEATLEDSGGVPPYYNYGIPTTTILDDASARIRVDPDTDLMRKPMGVVLGPDDEGCKPVTVYQVVITFTGSSGMTADQQKAITTALQQAVSKIRPFIASCDTLADQNDTISVNLPATSGQLAAPEKYVITVIAMQASPGAVFTGCSMTVNGVPLASYTFSANGIIPFLKGWMVGVIFT
jgi:hypothetical protein